MCKPISTTSTPHPMCQNGVWDIFNIYTSPNVPNLRCLRYFLFFPLAVSFCSLHFSNMMTKPSTVEMSLRLKYFHIETSWCVRVLECHHSTNNITLILIYHLHIFLTQTKFIPLGNFHNVEYHYISYWYFDCKPSVHINTPGIGLKIGN